MAADDGVLDHLGGHQLVVDVRLPRHAAAAALGSSEVTREVEEVERDDGGERGGDGGRLDVGERGGGRGRLSHTFDFVLAVAVGFSRRRPFYYQFQFQSRRVLRAASTPKQRLLEKCVGIIIRLIHVVYLSI